MKKIRIIAIAVLTAGLFFPVQAKEVKVLTIGNSFAQNALRYFENIIKAAGDTALVRRANLGGHSFENHWSYVEAYEKDPKNRRGSPYYGNKKSLKDLLTEQKWDYVTIQQVSHQSFLPETFHPYADNLIAYIRKYAPSAEIVIHETWAYRDDHPWFTSKTMDPRRPVSHADMHAKVITSYKEFQQRTGFRMIPCGEAMEAARSHSAWGPFAPDPDFKRETAVWPVLPTHERFALHKGYRWDKNKKLQRDCIHANSIGEYLQGCLWYEFFFRKSCLGNSFTPNGVSRKDAETMQAVAHGMMQRP